jgi:hypothetical protein
LYCQSDVYIEIAWACSCKEYIAQSGPPKAHLVFQVIFLFTQQLITLACLVKLRVFFYLEAWFADYFSDLHPKYFRVLLLHRVKLSRLFIGKLLQTDHILL